MAPKKPRASVSLSYCGYGHGPHSRRGFAVRFSFPWRGAGPDPGPPGGLWAWPPGAGRGEGGPQEASNLINPFLPARPQPEASPRAMTSLRPTLFVLLFFLARLGCKADPSASPLTGSDFPEMGHPSQTSPPASENSTEDQPNPDSPATASPEPSKTPHAGSPEPSSPDFPEAPNHDHQESPHPETPKSSSLNTSISDPLDTPQSNPSNMTHPEPSEVPTPDPTDSPHPESPETLKPSPSKTSHTEFPEPPNPDSTQTPHQESPEIPKLNSIGVSRAEVPEMPNPDPTKSLHPKSPETLHPDTTETPHSEFLQTLRPNSTESPHPESHVTSNLSSTDIPQTEPPTTHYQDATENSTTSSPEISSSLQPETTTPFKDNATALNALLPLNPKAETSAVTQPDTLKLPTSDSPGTVEWKASQDCSPKGPDALPSARIVGPPAPPVSPSQSAPATLRAPQRRSRGERVNTIIVVERVEETGEGPGPRLLGPKEEGAGGRDSWVSGRAGLGTRLLCLRL